MYVFLNYILSPNFKDIATLLSHAGSKQTLVMVRSRKTVRKNTSARGSNKKNLVNEMGEMLQKMTPTERKQFHKKFMKHCNIVDDNCSPSTPALPSSSSKTSSTITTPVGHSALECLQQVEQITKSTLAKNTVTTRDGRRKLTQIYNKFRKRKRDALPKKGRKLRPYDADGKGDQRFEAAYELIFL